MKQSVILVMAALAIAGPALAADLGTRGPPPPAVAPLAPAPYWTGLYIGINGGGGILNGDILDPECFSCADIKFQTGFGTVGGQIGYNWQINSFVFGLEGDFNWVGAKRSDGYALDDSSLAGTATLKMDAFSSIRARFGLVNGPTLVYITGGPAWGHFKSSVVLGDEAVPVKVRGIANDDEWRSGIAVGAGIEYMINNNWVLRGEYLFLDFLDAQQTMTFFDGSSCNVGGGARVPCKESFANTASVVRLGLSYKFQF